MLHNVENVPRISDKEGVAIQPDEVILIQHLDGVSEVGQFEKAAALVEFSRFVTEGARHRAISPNVEIFGSAHISRGPDDGFCHLRVFAIHNYPVAVLSGHGQKRINEEIQTVQKISLRFSPL
jgi:hypothetical protein